MQCDAMDAIFFLVRMQVCYSTGEVTPGQLRSISWLHVRFVSASCPLLTPTSVSAVAGEPRSCGAAPHCTALHRTAPCCRCSPVCACHVVAVSSPQPSARSTWGASRWRWATASGHVATSRRCCSTATATARRPASSRSCSQSRGQRRTARHQYGSGTPKEYADLFHNTRLREQRGVGAAARRRYMKNFMSRSSCSFSGSTSSFFTFCFVGAERNITGLPVRRFTGACDRAIDTCAHDTTTEPADRRRR
jgi:hypothetical protein